MNEFEAKRFFEPYIPWFNDCWRQGWEDYHRGGLSHPLDDSRSRSTAIQNRAIIHARLTFGSQAGIQYLEYNSRRLFKVGSGPYVQFKKLSNHEGELRHANNRTDTSEAFDRQEQLLGLDDVPRITVGYLPNDDHTDYSVYMAQSKNLYQNNWVFEVSGKSTVTTVDLFETQDEQLPEPAKRVRARNTGTNPEKSDQAASA